MIYTNTKVVKSTLRGIDKDFDLVVQQGGTYSGKTFGVLVALHIFMSKSLVKKKIRVIGQTVPHLKDGAIDDFETIIDYLGGLDDYSAQDKQYTIGNCTIKFQSIDKLGKAKGGKFDITFINECNEIKFAIVQQLILRTNDTVILDYNPSSEFWFHTKTSLDKS